MICTFQCLIAITFFLSVNCFHSFEDLEKLVLQDLENEFQNSTVSPLNNQTEGISSTTSVDYNWNLTFSYTYTKKVFKLTIISDSHKSPYESYTVELRHPGFLNPLEIEKVSAVQPKTTVNLTKVVPYTKNKFKIISYYGKYKSHINEINLNLGGYILTSINCNSLSPKLKMIPNWKEMSMTIVIKSKNPKKCFHIYSFYLGKFTSKCPKIDKILYQMNVTYDEKVVVKFENLTFGKYCLSYEAIHENCPDTKCIPMHKVLEFFKDDSQDIITPLPSTKASTSFPYLVPLVVSMTVVVALIVVVLVIIWKRNIHYKLIFYVSNAMKKPHERNDYHQQKEARTDEDKNLKKLIVPILYAQDCEPQNKVTVALFKFIKECFHVEAIIDVEDIANVNKGDVSWIENLVDYKCPKISTCKEGEDNKRLIILETACALKLYRSWKNQRNLYYKEYNALNELFVRGLDHLSNIYMHKRDYCHIFVARFSYSPSERMDIVETKRFLLPDCLVELYNCIHNKETDFTGQQSEILLQDWEKNDSFKDLKQAIKEMEEYVTNNSNYIDDMFLSDVSDLEDVCVV
ncbi:uncharacterized protein [Centruroides vittatus]|uniref:uncharacterized protein n=1 Tax=Centruroides vittatus TaxID=120091 RepID=UPI00350FC09F